MAANTPGGFSRRRLGIICAAVLASLLTWWWLKSRWRYFGASHRGSRLVLSRFPPIVE